MGTSGARSQAPGDITATQAERYAIFVLPALAMGGMEKQLLTIFEGDPTALRRHRIELLTFLPTANPIIAKRFADLAIPIHTIDRSRMSFPAFLMKLVRFFRSRRPHIVHAFLAGSTGTWGRLAARLAGVRVVMLSDRSIDPPITRVQRWLDPLLIRITARFVANAQATVDRLVRDGVPPRKIRLVRNAVILAKGDDDARASLRRRWGVADEARVVGFLGMLRPEKRPDLFLQALLRLPEADRPDLAVIAGDGVLMPQIKELVSQEPWLTRHCLLLGVVEDTTAFLQSIDALVLTSDAEGLPNVILEAMAVGVPSVGTRVSDVPYLIEDERFLASPGDAESVAVAILSVLRLTPEERSSMRVGLRARARREFDLATSARNFWDVHEDLWPLLPAKGSL